MEEAVPERPVAESEGHRRARSPDAERLSRRASQSRVAVGSRSLSAAAPVNALMSRL